MKTGLTISGAGHVAVLLFSLLTLVARPYRVDSSEALPVDVISASEFSQMTNGFKNAPQTDNPKPLVDKIGDPTPPVEDPNAKVGNKEIKAATDTPPVPEAKPPTPKAKPQPQTPVDPIADALKKDENKKPEPKKVEAKPPTPPKKPVEKEAPQFDPRNVAALLNKRDPQRLAVAGDEIGTKPALGVSKGASATLSQGEMDALKARLAQLWSPPAGAKDPQELIVEVEIKLKPDGTVDGGPRVLTSGHSELFKLAAMLAAQAVLRGQPFTMLKPENYEQWKDIVVTFDPRYMNGG